MRYMLLVYTTEEAVEKMTPDQRQALFEGHRAVMEETARRGILHGAAPLEPTRTATTVRMQSGKAMITDGPFAETKEQFAGYYVLECKDLDEAIEWASRIPSACGGGDGCVEIRPLRFQP